VHRVEVKTRRVGGAYGAKIVSSIFTAAAAAVAARALNKTVLMQNERVDDMTMLGGREGMEFRYNVAFENGGNDSGRISALDMLISMDGANSPAQAVGDLSMAVDWSDGEIT
jgi:xanthine dehydrogenase molybdopterin-binding subunit B